MLDVVALGELLIDFTCQSVDDEGYPTIAAMGQIQYPPQNKPGADAELPPHLRLFITHF